RRLRLASRHLQHHPRAEHRTLLRRRIRRIHHTLHPVRARRHLRRHHHLHRVGHRRATTHQPLRLRHRQPRRIRTLVGHHLEHHPVSRRPRVGHREHGHALAAVIQHHPLSSRGHSPCYTHVLRSSRTTVGTGRGSLLNPARRARTCRFRTGPD